MSEVVVAENGKLERRLSGIRKICEGINEIFPYVAKKIIRKRNNVIIRVLNEGIQGLVLLFFRPRYKKIVLGIKLGYEVARDLSKG